MAITFKQFLGEGSARFEIDGYKYEEYDDYEEDNIKTWHMLTPPGAKRAEALQHTPYESLSKDDVAKYVAFHKKHGRFPKYGEFGFGNLDKERLKQLEK